MYLNDLIVNTLQLLLSFIFIFIYFSAEEIKKWHKILILISIDAQRFNTVSKQIKLKEIRSMAAQSLQRHAGKRSPPPVYHSNAALIPPPSGQKWKLHRFKT